MTTNNALNRQPDTFDYAQLNRFKVHLPIFPNTEWFCTRANIPQLTVGDAIQPTPFSDIAVVGDKIQYDNFNISFIVDENLKNYMEIYNWMKNIGFPTNSKQFNSLERPDNTNRTFHEGDERNVYTDIQMIILSSKNNPVAKINFYEAFPITLGSLEYNHQDSDISYVTCDVMFNFTWFDVFSL